MRLWAFVAMMMAGPGFAAPDTAPRPAPRPALVTEIPDPSDPAIRQLAEEAMRALGYGREGPVLPEDEALLLAEDALVVLGVTRAVPFDATVVLAPALPRAPRP